ncbi:gp16 family protein [Moraxella equi]|uniref:Mu-like prophage protein gp16 n=1 Tax=Moraxella equi TaxID=60442 RepID=A0A378QPT8_9GAMM|nr:regulatory protein GemA [Moraxella equi]OPH34994.1 hypothetical protein B5J93_11600 [Moraxella equi]STZ02877.1 Mu-like prophage protein gp16 [Moraxella equi]
MTVNSKSQSTANKKKKLIQLIHIGKAKLHLDDETYRDILAYTTGKSSTKDMSLTELNVVLTELKNKGFTTTIPRIKRPNDPQSRLIRHLWLSLHDLGAVKDPSETALNTYIQHQAGEEFSRLESDKKSQIIEMLKKWRTRTKTQNADN